MALNTRLTQNIDLQADGTALTKALGVIETSLNNIIGKAGSLGKTLEGGANAGSKAWNTQLKQLNILIGQAQNLQKLLDANTNKRAGGILSALDTQALGKKGAAASRLAQDLTATSTAADVLEKRLSTLNKRFADLTLQGRTVGQRDLAKQFNTETALKDIRALEREFQKLSGQAGVARGTKVQQENMARLRAEIMAANAELAKMGQNYRRTDFGPQIAGIRNLTDEYRRAVAEARKLDAAQPGRALNAQKTAYSILNQTDAQRLASVQRAGSGFQFPAGVSNTITQKAAEDQLAASLNKRLRLIQMIQQAQDRGAPVRSVERLNAAYESLNRKLGEQFKLLSAVNKEQMNTPGTQAFRDRADRQRQAINEQLFGDGGIGFAKRIAGASVITTGVFALINGLQSATKFVVEYESALKQLQAISGSTDLQTRRLSESINEVATNSRYSTLEITKAATIIAQAGFSAQETGDVLRSAVNLSTAAGVDPTQAVETLTSALGAFQLQASESGRVVDVLVSALNRTKLSIEQVQSGIQYAAATANEAGISFEELTTIAASLANAGIRSGSTIGTGLRQLIVDMQTPSEKFKKELKDLGLTLSDVDVKALGFAQVVKNLTAAGFGAESAYESFETRAAAAFLALKGQMGTYDQLALSIAEGGAAAEAQAKAMDSLSAQWQRFLNITGSLATNGGGPILDLLKGILYGINSILEPLAALTGAFGDLIGSSTAATTAMRTLAGAGIGALFGPIGAVVGAIAGFVSGMNSAGSAMDDVRTKTSDASAAYDSQAETLRSAEDAVQHLIQRQDLLKTNHGELAIETTNLGNKFVDLQGELSKTGQSYENVLGIMQRFSAEQRRIAGERAADKLVTIDAERNATRQQLRNSGGVTNGIRQEFGNLITSNRYQQQNPGQDYGRFRDRIMSALSSEDQRVVGEAWREALKFSSANNNILRQTVEALKTRKDQLDSIRSLDSQEKVAQRQVSTSNITSGKTYLEFERRANSSSGLIQQGLRMNTDKAGSGKGTIDRAVAQIDADVKKLKAMQGYLKAESDEWYAVQTLIDKNTEIKTKVVRADRIQREQDAKIRPPRAAAGLTLSSKQVGDELKRTFGANVTSTFRGKNHPLTKANPNSAHNQDRALDMVPMKGVSPDNIVAYLESLGLGNVRFKNEVGKGRSKWATGDHWHFSWDRKQSNAAKQAANDLEQIRKAAATQAVGASSAAIQTIIARGKAGTGTASELNAALETAIAGYQATSLNKYDVDNPAAGLSGEALRLQKAGRADLQTKLAEDADKFRADLFRSIGDVAQKAFDTAMSTINAQLSQALYDAEAPVRAADSNIARSTSRLNKDRVGAGTSYYLQQQKEAAQINADRAKVAANDAANAQTAVSLDTWKTTIDAMPRGEAKDAQINAYTQAVNALNDSLRTTDELQQSINDRTQVYVNELPLEARLKSAAQAWADNSGVMQDWTSVMENNVGPALDMMTSTLTTVFAQIMDGSMGIKGALKSIITAVGQFVVQLIAKALALAAIKWFLKLIGVELIDTPGGVGMRKIPGKLQGGEINPKKLLNGGSTGYVNQGVFNKDTVPILGARGEFMLRKQAVDSLGLENVEALNRHGSKAMGKMAGAQVIPSAAHQEMSVYVIKPDEKPQLGPRDIVLAISDDMLQGGTTKQLVRKISQGAM